MEKSDINNFTKKITHKHFIFSGLFFIFISVGVFFSFVKASDSFDESNSTFDSYESKETRDSSYDSSGSGSEGTVDEVDDSYKDTSTTDEYDSHESDKYDSSGSGSDGDTPDSSFDSSGSGSGTYDTNTTDTSSTYDYTRDDFKYSSSTDTTYTIEIIPVEEAEPRARIHVDETSGVVSGKSNIFIDVERAIKVELYVIGKGSLTRMYLGVATKLDFEDRWFYIWDSTMTPNGEYVIFPIIENSLGLYEGDRNSIKVENEIINEITKDFINDKDEDYLEEVQILDETIKEEIKEFKNILEEKGVIEPEKLLEEEVGIIEKKLNEIIDEEELNYFLKIVERVGILPFRDSDGDGISDYDEINLYKTDPYVADSDGDGFIDGVEIAGGYDPLDPSREVAVAYENPKDKGVVKREIFSITKVAPIIIKKGSDGTETINAIIFEGRALPNSFVTIYIFSIPIIVTVKTDNDGFWIYKLDKELEDGEHEIYTAITDNTGKIVAKSDPVRFIKQAAAIEVIDIFLPTSDGNEPSFFNTRIILITILILLIVIGIILIMVGIESVRNKDKFIEDQDNV